MELTDIQKGYIAGLIDGEGYIGLSKRTDGHSPRLGIGMTDYNVLQWLKDLVGGTLYKRGKAYPTDSDSWCYIMTPRILRKILPVIAPYLKVKQKQACLMNLYFSYFEEGDRDSRKGLKSVIKSKFHSLFKIMNSRGNRKQGEFKESLSEVTLSQALGEIQEKVHRLDSDTKDIKREKIINSLRKYGRLSKSGLAKKHYFDVKRHQEEFDEIMAGLELKGVVKKQGSKYNKYFSYIYVGNESTSALRETDDIVRTTQRCVDVGNKESLR